MAKKTRSSKPAPSDTLAVNMIADAGVASTEDAALSELMAMLGETPTGAASDEVVEPRVEHASFADAVGASDVSSAISAADPIPGVPDTAFAVSGEDLAAAVAGAESVEAMIAAATPETIAAGEAPTGDASDVPAATTEAKPEKVRVPRKHYTNKAERIKDRLGDSLGEYTVLTLDDAAAALDEDALKAKMDDTMSLIAGMSKKKQNRAGFLLEFVSGKKATLNNVMAIALKKLSEDGALTTGKEGNYLTALLAVPYSPAAARAMGGNTVAVLEDLKLIVPDGKGKYVANPESLLLAKVNEMLGLATPGEATA